ncbi:MAG: Imidazole glycerol phosphate synthase subunit HisH 1 [Alphaproteobacteria bacterium MarineAlpha11_Bin1]|nr:MAG: Imidazole glycerol phosphate synthase subunit HisH 1 [Alphaproteobacteria bacterium MarineAlpha11_Bin1]|tara:strand:+ start:1657 stop:2313 length:657 start_codon:yes stop_codon:yes gene_type:complete
METIVIDYGSGNLRSAAKALERAGIESSAPGKVTVTANAAALDQADRIVLPGVGTFGDCAAGLRALPGMVEALERNVREKKKPFLGICVGMQLMADRGTEHGDHNGLGWIPGEVLPLTPADTELKIPHMGWNTVKPTAVKSHPLLAGFEKTAHAYFVHSYVIICENETDVIATSYHGVRMAAVIGRDNIIGTQFHPEKSQRAGLRLLGNFLKWDGEGI